MARAVPAVSLRGVSKSFGDVHAVVDLDLDIQEGEFFAMLGPSGSGKTTVLRLIAGFEAPTAGTVQLGGQDVTSAAPFDRDVTTVFQDYALFPHMSVVDNVAYGLRVRGVGQRERRERAAEALATVALSGTEKRSPTQLSGGQRQRVALARALAIEPRLLLLDEPFGALDALVRKEVRRWVRRLHEQLGITTILVTHDQEEAMELADRVAVMERGTVVQFAPPAELLEAPATPFVAGFIGEAAKLDCSVRSGVAHFDPLPLPPVRVALPDGAAIAFVRPYDLVAVQGEGAVLQSLRASQGEARAVVDAGGSTLDAVLQAPSGWARRGAPCRLQLRGAQVFGASGTRATAAPLFGRAMRAG